jgi:hypothetical protein
MTTTEQIKALAKRHGVISFAKVILEEPTKYAKALTEHEFVDLLMEEAKAFQREGESLGQSFSKLFQAQTTDGLLLRQAHQAVVKANRAAPVTEFKAPGSTFDKLLKRDGESSAYSKLMEKAELLQKFDPSLTADQAFAKAYTGPANRDLANQERRENRPQSTFYPEGGERQ